MTLTGRQSAQNSLYLPATSMTEAQQRGQQNAATVFHWEAPELFC